MTNLSKLSVAGIIIALALVVLVGEVVRVRQQTFETKSYTTNSGEIVSDTLIGQTFQSDKADLSGISVMFATYSNRKNTHPVILHLRNSIDSNEDIRTVTVDPAKLNDNQLYRFDFEPIHDSKDKTYFFFIVSPESVAGDAVTIDLDTRDPYHLGSAYIAREITVDKIRGDVLARSGKPTIDIGFGLYHTVSFREAAYTNIKQALEWFVLTWGEREYLYGLWLRTIIPVLLFFLVLHSLRESVYENLLASWGKRRYIVLLLGILFIAAFIIRYTYATQLPVTNDEGNYFYDAKTLLHGSFAGGDGYVKAPLVIAWIAFWQFLLGNSIIAGRLSSVFIGALTLYPLYFLARDIWNKRAGLAVAAVWAFFGAAIVFNIYAHTQPLALFFGISGLAVIVAAIRGTTPRLTFISVQKAPSAIGWFFLGGILLGLGVASRKSILALGIVPLYAILAEDKTVKERWKHLLAVGLGFLLVIAIFLLFAYLVYGQMGIIEAIGLNSAEDGLSEVDPAEIDQVREYSLKGMTPFFRESLPLILLACIGFGLAGEKLIVVLIRRISSVSSRFIGFLLNYVIPKLGWIPAWLTFYWAWSFFSEYEGAAFMFWGIPLLWQLFAVTLALLTVLPRPRQEMISWHKDSLIVEKTMQPGFKGNQVVAILQQKEKQSRGVHSLTAFLLIPLWILGLAFFYMNWIKFHANYISEFIPPLAIFAGFGAVALFERLKTGLFLQTDYPIIELLRRVSVAVVILILGWSIFVSNYITYVYEHTGTFDQAAAKEASVWAKQFIQPTDAIFTGAALIPYLSGHHVSLDIAHPRWYAYEFTRKNTARLNTFLPPAEDMVQAFRDAKWVLMDQQTGFSFLMEYSEIEKAIETDFEAVKGIENGSNTLTFYRRIK